MRRSLVLLVYALLSSQAVGASASWHGDVAAMADRDDYLGAAGLLVEQFEAAPSDQLPLVFWWLGRVFRHSGDNALGYSLTTAALVLAESTHAPDDPELARYYWDDALICRLVGERERASQDIDAGLSLVARGVDSAQREMWANLVQARANWMRRHDPWPKVIEEYEKAVEIRRQAFDVPRLSLADNLIWLGHAYQSERRYDDLLDVMTEALEILDSLGLPEIQLRAAALDPLASLALARGDCELAVRLEVEAMRIQALGRERLLPGFAQRKFSQFGYEKLVGCFAALGDQARAWDAVARSGTNTAGESDWELQRHAEDPRWAQLEARRAILQTELESKIPTGPVPPERLDERTLSLLVEIATLRVESWRLHRELEQETQPDSPPPLDVTRLQQMLRPGEAVIAFRRGLPARGSNRSGYSASLVGILRADRSSRWIELDPGRGVIDRLNRLFVRTSQWRLRAPDDPLIRELLEELYRARLNPIESELDGIDTLLVVGYSGDAVAPIESWFDGESYVDERWTVRYVDDLHALMEERVSPRAESALVIADPLYRTGRSASGSPLVDGTVRLQTTTLSRDVVVRGLSGDARALEQLPRLPFGRWEGEQVADRFGRREILAGADATEERVRQLASYTSMSEFDVIHFAAHALVHPAFPERSALALDAWERDAQSDGLLFVAEIAAEWNLDAELVALSGCQTFGSSVAGRPTAVGFPQALLARGAKRVLSSRWKVDDAATALLMARFYANWTGVPSSAVRSVEGAPLSPHAALREARQWLRQWQNSAGQRPFAHPVYWSAFFLLESRL